MNAFCYCCCCWWCGVLSSFDCFANEKCWMIHTRFFGIEFIHIGYPFLSFVLTFVPSFILLFRVFLLLFLSKNTTFQLNSAHVYFICIQYRDRNKNANKWSIEKRASRYQRTFQIEMMNNHAIIKLIARRFSSIK